VKAMFIKTRVIKTMFVTNLFIKNMFIKNMFIKNRFLLLSSLIVSASPAFGAEALSGQEILKRVDKNQFLDHAVMTATMVVHGRSGSRTITSKSWVSGKEKSFSEYLSPAREKGKKMLKLGDKLWIYTPEPHDRIIAIAGHLLKQSVMGSDLSYEDLMSNDSMEEDYDAKIIGKETIDGRQCLVLDLTAKREGVSYYKRKVWVDSDRWIFLQSDMLAKGGKLLKRATVKDVLKLENRWYPKEVFFKDMLARGGGTEYHIDSIDLNTKIPDRKFTKASLRR
jgi:outer membrane lipoprotein-sorting protein